MISEARYFDSAKQHNVEVLAIKAVTAVESNGKAFLASGEPVILFEPHVFWKQLEERKYNPATLAPSNSDILYKKWNTKPYGPSTAQHERLQRASLIDRDAAICSASWGMFQIMGYHYKACGCATVQEFVNAMYKSQDEHLRLFMNFLESTGIIKFLRARNWEAFAEAYNGKSYKENNYHIKLPNAYDALKKLRLPNQLQ